MEARRYADRYDRPLTSTIRATSKHRCWSGIEAIVYETSGGFARSTPGPNHCFTMHLSAPIHTVCGCDGKVVPRLQVMGDIDFLPAGSCASWQDEGETLMVGVKIAPSLALPAAE